MPCRPVEFNAIELMSPEDFKSSAPEELQVDPKADPHLFEMNRLTFELKERQRLEAEVENLKKERKAARTQLLSKQKFLEDIPGYVQSIETVRGSLDERFASVTIFILFLFL